MNAANQITLARIILVPVFLIFLLNINTTWASFVCVAIFLVAAITDFLDGYVARKYNQVTNFGKFIDPLADKLLVTAALIGLVELRHLSAWMAIIIISREFIVTSLRIVAISQGKVIAASVWGKIKTVTQMIAIVALLSDDFLPFDELFFTALIYVAVIVTLISGVDYIWKNRSLLSSK